ncbi:MAG: electron transfer flavoprotein subunit beta/FixA family protein [Deltaproteobacteria bacterium]|nr:electron transfer flavoprotein subunit beta/FixA family protein [Deltaproteobacteria bacterium]MBW2136631.1 electron transfer flavoprotein subunit beta/FixA family protein [Deltaproteobacteria bacterium]
MNTVVLIKQVPDTTEIKLDPKTGTLIREGVQSIINPDDLHALESAIGIKESMGGRITVLSMGPAQAIDVISEAIGMGADEGILLTDKAFAGADTWATSYTLGKAIERIGTFDLIICGRQAIDGDTAQIGPQVADFLGIPQVTYVFDIEEMGGNGIAVKRRLEDGFERVQCSLPALLTVTGEMNAPRYPQVGRLIDSCSEKAPIKVWDAADIGVKTSDVGLEGSLTHVIKTFAPKQRREGEIIEGDAKEAVNTLLGKLKERKLL